jgi:spermidine synthase
VGNWSPSPKAVLYAIFFLSGAAALIFESLWFRQAGLAFGNSVWATSLVLTGFMAGLGLGNALAARFADRFPNPIRAYAVVEATIALTGVALVLVLPSMGLAFAPLLRALDDAPLVLNAARFALAFALLMIPATAMGVTLPLMTRALCAIEPRFGAVLGALYGWNTIGAMAGTIATEAVLLGAFGIRGTALLAGACNLVAAALALGMSRSAEPIAPASAERASINWRRAAPWLASAFLCGFAVLAYEVVWFRFMLLYVPGLGLSFALMLGTVLAGIALGGWSAASALRRDPEAHRDAFSVVLRAGVAGLLSYAIFPLLLELIDNPKPDGTGEILLLAFGLMFPTSFYSGTFFTMVGASLRSAVPSDAATAAALTLSNTVGAALGSFTAGFLLLPGLGVENTTFLLGCVLAAAGLLLAGSSGQPRRAVAMPVGVFVLAAALFPFGSMREFHIEARTWWYGGRIAEVREGLVETIVYLEDQFMGRRRANRMVTNGFSMSGSSTRARRYMKLYTYLPLAVNPRIQDVLMINFGVGQTAKSITDTKSFQSIDFVDISPDVFDMVHNVFPEPGTRPQDDPRVTVHIEDGRYFLQTTDRKFDLFTGEPPPPPLAGVVNLYTREYFQLVRDHLNDGGLVTYWLPIHNLTDVSSKAILRSFCDVFPDCQLWNGMDTSLMMVGSKDYQGGATLEEFTAQWRDPALHAELDALGFEKPEQLGSLFIGGPEYLRELCADTPALVDDDPKLILAPFTTGDNATNPLFLSWTKSGDETRRRFAADPVIRKWFPKEMIDGALPYFDVQHSIDEYAHARSPGFDRVRPVLESTDLEAPVLWLLGSDADIQNILAQMSAEEREAPEAAYHEGVGLLSRREWAKAAASFSRATDDDKLGARAAWLRAYAHARAGNASAARIAAVNARMRDRDDPAADAFWEWFDEFEETQP